MIGRILKTVIFICGDCLYVSRNTPPIISKVVLPIVDIPAATAPVVVLFISTVTRF